MKINFELHVSNTLHVRREFRVFIRQKTVLSTKKETSEMGRKKLPSNTLLG
jgi:hypothetical protein